MLAEGWLGWPGVVPRALTGIALELYPGSGEKALNMRNPVWAAYGGMSISMGPWEGGGAPPSLSKSRRRAHVQWSGLS